MVKDYSNWSKDELARELKKFEKRKNTALFGKKSLKMSPNYVR